MKNKMRFFLIAFFALCLTQGMLAKPYLIRDTGSAAKEHSANPSSREKTVSLFQKKTKAWQDEIKTGFHWFDFSDPVSKWLWFSLLAYAGGILFYIIGLIAASPPLWIAGYVLWLAATVFFVIWLVRRFGSL